MHSVQELFFQVKEGKFREKLQMNKKYHKMNSD